MECNKDEAIKAIEIAEKKLAAKDIMGANKFAVKAQNMYPRLEGVSQMLTMLEVYIAAENKVHGEADWYGILGLNSQADDETVRKQYRKLALLIHPDKNKSAGAEGSFRLISEAWSFLSDKGKKQEYDLKRSAKHSSGANRSHYFSGSDCSNARTAKNTAPAGSSSTPPPEKQKLDTFWTLCKRCNMQYEYPRQYLNRNLLCRSCNGGFLATEISPPPCLSSTKRMRCNSKKTSGDSSSTHKNVAKRRRGS